MSRSVRFKVSLTALLLASASPALAQRAGENAVASAKDAFGTSVGNERVGLYSPQSARGFSPIQAGNVRINGLYFDFQTDLNARLISGSNVRVGLTAQGYPFPAPTGVADFSLRLPGANTVASIVAGLGPFNGLRAEVDAQMPLTSTLAVAAGGGINQDGLHFAGHRLIATAAAVARWRPAGNVEVIPFWSMQDTSSDEGPPTIFTAGAFLPPKIERGRYFGPDWALNESRGFNYGLLSTVSLGDWTLRGGAFRSVADTDRSFNILYLNTTQDGEADRLVNFETGKRSASTSGELRLTRQLIEGDRLHQIHLMTRGRMQDRRYGASQRINLGRGRIDEKIEVPEPDFSPGPQTTDEVRQVTAGLGYEGRWRGVGELSLGIQRSFYEKSVVRPSGALPVTKASPWLFNGTLSFLAGDDLVFYGGYSKGLEESPVAPPVAVNQGEAPPAIITEQKDAGLRYALTPSLSLVAGVFDVAKPYFALDPGRLFRQLGEVRNRGIEVSFAGQITPRLNLVVGALLLDARVSGDAVDLGLLGKRPLNSMAQSLNSAVNWDLPWVKGLSLDAALEATSDRVANAANTLVVPARYALAIGGRYRFDLAGKPAVFRVQVPSINNAYGYNVFGDGFYYNLQRRWLMNLTVDI